jgi:filamentous hemagglutinin family protein
MRTVIRQSGVPVLIGLLVVTGLASAQEVPIVPVAENSPDSTETRVLSADGNPNQVNIEGGRRSSDGTNLFHSFQEFGLRSGQTANFVVNPGIRNILSRVTGGNPSIIDGQLRVSSTTNLSSTANLYFMNPAGILFGASASLNVSGSLIATTANGIGFGNNGWLSAIGANNYSDLNGNPDQLAFTMPQPGAIVLASSLSGGSRLILAGGSIVSTDPLSRSGEIIVTAVPGTSLLQLNLPGSPLSLEIQPATAAASLPADWNQKVLALPDLLTGGQAGNAYGLTVDDRGQVTLTGAGVRVENGDIVTGALSGSSAVRLWAIGNVTVATISGGIIDVTAGNLFRAIGTLPGNPAGTGVPVSISSTGSTVTFLPNPPFQEELEIRTSPGGSITIRHAGGVGSSFASSDGSIRILGGGTVPFVIGPATTPPQPPPAGVSGTAGAIFTRFNQSVNDGRNQEIVRSFRNLVFSQTLSAPFQPETPPRGVMNGGDVSDRPTPQPVSVPAVQPAAQGFTVQDGAVQVIQRQPGDRSRGKGCTSSDAETDPACVPTIDDRQILLILEQTPEK